MQDNGEIYERYARTVYRYLLSLTGSPDIAEELTQETFFRAIKQSDRFDGSSSMTTWLCGIAKRVRLEYARKHKEQAELEEVTLTSPSAEESAIASESRIELLRALHGLEEPAREVTYLRAFGGLSFREIGAVLGITENNARAIFFRAKQKLGKELEK